MLKDLLRFFLREKSYFFLFLIIAATYGVVWSASRHEARESPGSEDHALKVYETAEARMQKEMESAGSPDVYFRKHPEVKGFFYGSALVFSLLFFAGMAVDLPFFFNPGLRSKINNAGAPSGIRWGGGLLLKWLLLFLSSGMAVSLLFEALGRWRGPDSSDNFYLLLHTTIVDFLGVWFIYYLIRRSNGSLRDLGFWVPPGNFFREFFFGLGAYFAVMPFFLFTLLVVVFLAQLFSYEPPVHPLVNVFLEEERRSPLLVAYSVFLATCVGPFLEEVFFRGFCYPIFRKKFGIAVAVVLSASLFAFIHENTFAFWPIFALGLALAYVYEKRKSIIAPVVLHILHNALFIGYFFYAKNIVMPKGGP